MIETLKVLILNKSFLLGAILSICVFSKYIFGSDNLAEQLGELLIYITTRKNIDFSPEDNPALDKDYIKKYKELNNENDTKGS